MKKNISSTRIVRLTQHLLGCGLILLSILGLSFAATPPSQLGQGFKSAEDAARALADAAKDKDRSRLKEILGPDSDALQMTDKVQGDMELTDFATAYDTEHRVVTEGGDRATLEVGANNWPLPIPLVQKNGQWFFDTEAGKDEVINRRIGRNELSALKTVRAYEDAQREYASRDRNGDQVLEYAQKIVSTPGTKDGLYWAPDQDGSMSPLGPLVAEAAEEGYTTASNDQSGPKPFHGYYFKILKRQGSHAPGGKYDYVINGHMIGGFALIAWPVDYGNSGVMTFVINQQGKVYQKDLGPQTSSIAPKIDTYDPDSTWAASPD